MRRSRFVTLGLIAFGTILAMFVIRGSTRLVIGDTLSLWLVLPLALISVVLVLVLFVVAILDVTGIAPMTDDLGDA